MEQNTTLAVLYEIGTLQDIYQKKIKKGITKRELCDLIIPFRDKYHLNDSTAIQIAAGRMSLLNIAKTLDSSNRKEN